MVSKFNNEIPRMPAYQAHFSLCFFSGGNGMHKAELYCYCFQVLACTKLHLGKYAIHLLISLALEYNILNAMS